MKTIWKYQVPQNGIIEMQKDAEVLCLQKQGDNVCIWALVESDNEKEKRHFLIYGTSHPIKETNIDYIGTFQMEEGMFIYHVFEQK